jgi:hypothetical protein
MSTTIICPKCQHQFAPTDAMRDEVEKELRAKMLEWQSKREDDFKKKENQLQQQLRQQEELSTKKLEEERRRITDMVSEQIRKQLAADYEVQLKMMQEHLSGQEEKLKAARQKELEFLRREQEIINKEKELEIELQKMLLQERTTLAETIRKEEAEKNALKETEYRMKMKELELQLEAQRKLAEEMKRKAEQGSMQLQGEVQEVELEELLRAHFPFDLVSEVGKGIRGADCIQTVRNSFGQECGRIIYESKRTQAFSNDWIEKLKADMRQLGADIAVIVTQAMPRDMDSFGEKDGVWICCFEDVKPLAAVLRDLVIRVHTAAKSQENKGDKMTLLYTYLTSGEFSQQWKAIREGFMAMRLSIQKERDAMEKLWKAREKQLEKVLLNAAHIKGSIEGIAGMDHVDLDLGEGESGYLLE